MVRDTDDDLTGVEDDIGALLDEANEGREAPERQYNRDEVGKFAPRPREEAPAPAQAAPVQTPQEPPWKPVWYKDDYGDWSKLPEPLRQALREREQGIERKLQEVGGPANNWRQLEQMLQPWQQQLQQAGVQPAEYFAQLHQANEFLLQDPVRALAWLAQENGVDLVDFAQQVLGQTSAGRDPTVAYLKQQVEQLEDQLHRVSTTQQSFTQAQQAARDAALRDEVETFGKDKPHFSELKPVMARLLQAGEAHDLPSAYEKAVWLHPDARERILQDQRRTNVSRARAQAVSPRGAPIAGGRASNGARLSLEDEIAGLIDGLQ
jgi:hypothetical protein